MKHYILLFIGLVMLLLACKTPPAATPTYESETLIIRKLSENTFVHTTYLSFKNFGKVPCNGMIVIDGQEAIVFDTPTTDTVSTQLIDWIRKNLNCQVKAVVVTHFHVDCLGGLDAFHDQGITSYANRETIRLANEEQVTPPENGFDQRLELSVGKQKVINEFLGEGHTKDNIVCYVPEDKVLFGGCLIKGMGSGKGNLADANTDAWSNTVKQVKAKFEIAQQIIPGHGKAGGRDLLDYTIELFDPANKAD